MKPLRILLIVFAVLILSTCKESSQRPEIGAIVPGFALPDLAGSKVNVPGDFSGKVTVIRFWANTCPHCINNMRDIDFLYTRYKDMGLVVIAVNVAQSKQDVETFIEKLDITYTVLLDTESVVSKPYGVASLPTTFILDRNGILKVKIIGETTIETMAGHISGLM